MKCSSNVLEPLPAGEARDFAMTSAEVRSALELGRRERAAAERILRGRRTVAR